jgi:transcriptional regulator with XRE-family HTH domain
MNIAPNHSGFGQALKQRREYRRMSQLELALEANVSTRHLSFLETGRARPSRDMVLTLAEALILPHGETNGLLSLAGFAPAFAKSPLNATHLAPMRAAMALMMERHAPWPAMVLDRHWNLQDANPTASLLLSHLAPASMSTATPQQAGALNMIELMCDSARAGQIIVNLGEVQRELLGRVRLERLESGLDETLARLERQLKQALVPLAPNKKAQGQPIIPITVRFGGQHLSFLTTIAHFGSSHDITIRDLRLELLFPADETTRQTLEGLERYSI